MKILIVDDNTDLCTILQFFFEKRGFTVLTANTLLDGLRIVDEEEPSILFIDNYLPDGEGWKAARTLKFKYPAININLISGKDKSFGSLEMERSDVFIWEKPITTEQLEAYLTFQHK